MPNLIPRTGGFTPAQTPAPARTPMSPGTPAPPGTKPVGLTAPGTLAATPTATAAVPAGGTAMSDPAYQAYLRAMGVQESEIKNILGVRVGALVRQLGRKLPEYAATKAQDLKQVGADYEDRGFFRSGNRLAEQSRVGISDDRARMNYEAEIRDQIAELYGTSAQDLARLRQAQAEQALTGQQTSAIASANAGIA